MVTARQVVRASGFIGLTGLMVPPFLVHARTTGRNSREATRDAWVSAWARALLHLYAIEVVVKGAVPEKTRGKGRGRLVVANHRSAIDIGIMLATFGGSMVSRADIATWPLVGAAARAVGTLFVDRASAKSGALAIRTIQKHLETGRTVNLFPEGTTFDGDLVRAFHGGAFVSAVRAEAEVMPVGIAYPKGSGAAFVGESFPSHLSRMSNAAPSRMVVAVGEPFIVRRSERATDVVDHAHRRVQALVETARAECGP